MKYIISAKPYSQGQIEKMDGPLPLIALTLYQAAQQFVFLRHHLIRISVDEIEANMFPPHIEARLEFEVDGRRYGISQSIMWLEMEIGREAIERVAREMCHRAVTVEFD
jgi:hypothetical protein